MDLFPFPWQQQNVLRDRKSPVILATGIRLYRNLQGVPFLERAGKDEQFAVAETVNRALDQLPDFCSAPVLSAPFPQNECACMQESRLITPEFAKMRFSGQVIRFSQDRTIAALINGGDHVVLSSYGEGLVLPALREKLNGIDDALAKILRFAFHPQYGYLSPDPGNAGTGMEISVLLHLPGIALMDEVKPMLTAAMRLGLKCRGIFDLENKFPGNLYVISNQSKLGESEEQLLARLEKIVTRIAGEEMQARERLFRNTPMKAADFCYRSLAVLAHARMISSVEALNALSGLKLAQDRAFAAELIPADLPQWDELLVQVMPGHVTASCGCPEECTPEQRAVRRAELLRTAFGGRSS